MNIEKTVNFSLATAEEEKELEQFLNDSGYSWVTIYRIHFDDEGEVVSESRYMF